MESNRLMSVEAMRFDGTNGDAIGNWVAGHGKPAKVYTQGDGDPQPSYVEFPMGESTPESPLWRSRAAIGFWIVLGPRGFERWTNDRFERVFHTVGLGGVSRSMSEGAAERMAAEQAEG